MGAESEGSGACAADDLLHMVPTGAGVSESVGLKAPIRHIGTLAFLRVAFNTFVLKERFHQSVKIERYCSIHYFRSKR